jgi:CubicO group peptidase (beta-lactamase class C family)
MRFLTRLTAVWLLAVALPLFAATPQFSPAKLAEIPKSLAPFLETNLIAGAVTLVAQRGEVVALDALGHSNLDARRKMKTDDLFWIASMTKPMTAVAILMLQDDGKLSVEDPVEKYLPEFKGQWLTSERSVTGLGLIKPARPVRIRDLLTHTSGLGDLPAPRGDCSLAELVMAYSQMPLKFQPGSKWEYCNSGINTLGRIVEVVSGKPYAKFMQQRLFDPLDMDDTTFWPSRWQLKRVAKPYQASPSGGLVEGSIYFLKGPLTDRTRTPFPAGGLFSTASDVAHFYQMMLNGGLWRGKRLLSLAAATELTRTQTGEIKTGFVDGMSYGYGFAVVKEPAANTTRMLSSGTFGHGGAYGTQSWADPKRDLIFVLMYNWSKVPNADASPMREAFQNAVVHAFSE